MKLNSGQKLKNFLETLAEVSVEEAKKSLNENFYVSRTQKTTEQPKLEQKQELKEQDAIAREESGVEDIVSRINSIRAGRSTEDLSGELKDYYESLDDGEKKVLLSFLKSIGAIMSGDVQGEELPSPEKETGVEVATPKEMEKYFSPRKKVVVRDEEEDLPPVPEETPKEDEMGVPIQLGMKENLKKNIKKLIA